VFALDIVELPMTAVAGDYDCIRAGGLDLLHLTPAIIDAFLIVSGDQSTATAAAAKLIHAGRIQVGPILHALVQDPAGFIKITVTEYVLGVASVITGVMVGSHAIEL